MRTTADPRVDPRVDPFVDPSVDPSVDPERRLHRTAPPDREALRRAWAMEHAAARVARAERDAPREWHHLERAHVLSQPIATAHVRTHLAMLAHGLRRRDRREIAGQVVRLLVAGPGSLSGRYPVGNTGGADVSALAPMPIPDDLRDLLGARS
jgi:hypothetical protein